MNDLTCIYSTEYKEDIAYYASDLTLCSTVFGCGYDTGKGYYLTFDDDGNLEEVNQIDD